SDCLAVVAATRLEAKREPAMAIDIGTNTEIALVHEGRLAATSCASGPAFEGYQMKCGMKAAEGAVERVSFSADGMPETIGTIGGVTPVGICGSGVVDILAGLVALGIVDKSGRMQSGHERVRKASDGLEYFLAEGAHGDIVFTQHDVRALQLAKGAIVAGWTLLLEHEGLTADDLRHVYIAGAFGNYLDLENALAIDLIPPVPKPRVAFVGNAAGVGAQMALVDTRERERIAELRRRIAFLELATHSRFHEVFTRALTFV
ncbi:MAG TPA: ATP-binding protein, partial [Thermoleophilia bacterium]|nr:ATP-binding protein [Thermoleophilia bacterium]